MGGRKDSTYLPGSPWTGRRFFAVLGAWLAGGVVGGFITLIADIDPTDDPTGLVIVVLAQAVAALVVVLAISQGSGTGSLRRDLGLVFRRGETIGILWGIGLQIGVALALSPLLRWLADDFDTQQQVADLAESTSSVSGQIQLAVMFVLVAPVVEEVIFRGVLMGWLAKRLHIRWAIVISAAAFASVHLLDPNAVFAAPGLFAIGIGLGWAAHRKGNIGIAIYMHAGVNLLGTIVLLWGDSIVDYLEDAQGTFRAIAAPFGIG